MALDPEASFDPAVLDQEVPVALEASCVDRAFEVSFQALPLSSEGASPLASAHSLVSVAAEALAAATAAETNLLKMMMRTMVEQIAASCILASVPCILPKDNKASNINKMHHYIHINVPTCINRNMSFLTSFMNQKKHHLLDQIINLHLTKYNQANFNEFFILHLIKPFKSYNSFTKCY